MGQLFVGWDRPEEKLVSLFLLFDISRRVWPLSIARAALQDKLFHVRRRCPEFFIEPASRRVVRSVESPIDQRFDDGPDNEVMEMSRAHRQAKRKGCRHPQLERKKAPKVASRSSLVFRFCFLLCWVLGGKSMAKSIHVQSH